MQTFMFSLHPDDVFIMLVLLLSFSLISMSSGYCETEESLKVKHYHELGCKPVQDINGHIKRFTCPDFELFDKEVCHHHGDVYRQQEYIEQEHLGFCDGACFCDKQHKSHAQFICIVNVCPEKENEYNENCIFQHWSVKKCCASSIICDEDTLKNLYKCFYNNNTYHHEEFIYPTTECDEYRCICDENFDEFADPSKNPKCEIEGKCDLELRYLHQFQKGCSPVYFGKTPRCPGTYRCPKKDDEIIRGCPDKDDEYEDVCKFGELILRRGDKLDDKCFNCTCLVPPMLFCRQSKKDHC